MKLLIEISDTLKQIADEEDIKTFSHFMWQAILMEAIKNGTPLPKGHGRLIDADAYIDKHEECGWLDDISVDEFNKITPTIIDGIK